MLKRLWKVVALILISFFAITACERPASRPPIATPQAIETIRPLVTLTQTARPRQLAAVMNNLISHTIGQCRWTQIVITPYHRRRATRRLASPMPRRCWGRGGCAYFRAVGRSIAGARFD